MPVGASNSLWASHSSRFTDENSLVKRIFVWRLDGGGWFIPTILLECFQFPDGSDNYGVLVHDADSGQTACIGAGDAQAAMDALSEKGWTLSHLLITHHHGDHTAGLQQIKQASGCQVLAPVERSKSIAGIDQSLDDDDSFEFAGKTVNVIHTPGHTVHINPDQLFVADKLTGH